MSNIIATEKDAKDIGKEGTATNNKMCTKSRAETLGCFISNKESYAPNLLIKKKDLFRYITVNIYKSNTFFNTYLHKLESYPNCRVLVNIDPGCYIDSVNVTNNLATISSFSNLLSETTNTLRNINLQNINSTFILNIYTETQQLNIKFKLEIHNNILYAKFINDADNSEYAQLADVLGTNFIITISYEISKSNFSYSGVLTFRPYYKTNNGMTYIYFELDPCPDVGFISFIKDKNNTVIIDEIEVSGDNFYGFAIYLEDFTSGENYDFLVNVEFAGNFASLSGTL